MRQKKYSILKLLSLYFYSFSDDWSPIHIPLKTKWSLQNPRDPPPPSFSLGDGKKRWINVNPSEDFVCKTMFVPLHWFIGFPERVLRRVSLKPFHERSFSLHSHLFFFVFCSKRELLKSEGFRAISFDVICFLILLMFPNCFCRRVSQRGSVINVSERCYAPL